MLDRLCLGTVQFGLAYGISNKNGMVSKEEIFKILEYARKEGIDILDTAYAYGESEKIIGEFLSVSGGDFNIISKMPDLDDYPAAEVEELCSDTLKRLRQPGIYGYLIHKFDNILRYKNLLRELESLKKKGFVRKIGASLYNTEELEYLLDNNIRFDILQLPYSVFDRRFENHFSLLKENKVEIYARSVFLQGLVFLNPEDLPENLIKSREYIAKLHNVSAEHNISVNALCLNFALRNTYVDKVIIGVDNLAQLEKNIKGMESMEKTREVNEKLGDLYIDDENIISPYKWGRG